MAHGEADPTEELAMMRWDYQRRVAALERKSWELASGAWRWRLIAGGVGFVFGVIAGAFFYLR